MSHKFLHRDRDILWITWISSILVAGFEKQQRIRGTWLHLKVQTMSYQQWDQVEDIFEVYRESKKFTIKFALGEGLEIHFSRICGQAIHQLQANVPITRETLSKMYTCTRKPNFIWPFHLGRWKQMLQYKLQLDTWHHRKMIQCCLHKLLTMRCI